MALNTPLTDDDGRPRMASCTALNACDITAAANQLAAEGYPVDPDDLATVSPYITENVRRVGEYVLDLAPPDEPPDTRLDLVPGALFPPSG